MPRRPSLTPTLLALALAALPLAAVSGACSNLKVAEGPDGAVVASPDAPASSEPTEGAAPAEDAAAPPDGEPPPDTSPPPRPQTDGGAGGRPTCVGGNSESFVPNPGCRPGACTFSKVVRVCKNGACAGGYCQELDWVAESPRTTPGTIYAVWGAAPDAVWAVGDGVYFFNGTSWTPIDIGVTFDNFTQAFAVAGTTREDVSILVGNYTTGPMVLRRRDAAGVFKAVAQLNNGGVWGGGLFALGNDRFLIHQGSNGVYYAAPGRVDWLGALYGFPAGHHYTNALSGFTATDVLVASAGARGSFYFDGNTLQQYGAPAHALVYVPDAIGLLSSGSKVDLWGPTTGTRIGATVNLYTESQTTDGYWQGIDGTSLDRIFVAGSKGIVLRRSASGWAKETIPSPAGMIAVWASPWGDVYTTGSKVWHGQ